MVAHESDLLGPHHDGDKALRLGGLRRLVAQDLLEAEIREPRVARANACGADHVGCLQKLALGGILQLLELLFVAMRQLAELVFEREQFLQFLMVRRVEVANLVVQGQEVHAARHSLPALGAEPHDLEASFVQLLCQLVHRNVGRRAHQDLALVLPREVVDDRGARHGLPRAGRALDQVQRALHGLAHRVDLRVIQLWQVRRGEVARRLGAQRLRLDVVPEELVVQVPGDAGVVNCKCPHARLHPVERR
mmetsp:Transcript_56805/g.172959  ORF Transcript_56805/g.172959 Transcript_56805/m.172959 type:complete len:249 (-) Transcript_56805:1355-2101(-)